MTSSLGEASASTALRSGRAGQLTRRREFSGL